MSLNENILVTQGIAVVSAKRRLGYLPSTATNYYLNQIQEEDKKAIGIFDNLCYLLRLITLKVKNNVLSKFLNPLIFYIA